MGHSEDQIARSKKADPTDQIWKDSIEVLKRDQSNGGRGLVRKHIKSFMLGLVLTLTVGYVVAKLIFLIL